MFRKRLEHKGHEGLHEEHKEYKLLANDYTDIMDTITWADFEKIDIRVGTIIDAVRSPKAKKPAYQLTIDFGEESGLKTSSAQITTHYSIEDLKGHQVIAVINFPPKNIAGFISECLVLGVYDENKDVVLLQPQRQVLNGAKIG